MVEVVKDVREVDEATRERAGGGWVRKAEIRSWFCVVE